MCDEIQAAKDAYDEFFELVSEAETDAHAIEKDGQDSMVMDALSMGQTLISMKEIQRCTQSLELAVTSLNDAYMAQPDRNHSEALIVVKEKLSQLNEALRDSELETGHDLRKAAAEVVRQTVLVQSKATPVVIDVKPCIRDEVKPAFRSNYKVTPMKVPDFSGKIEDWIPFWRSFSNSIDKKEKFDDETKLSYLVGAMKDPVMQSTYFPRLDDEGAYAAIVAELKSEYDRPRIMHRKYCESMKGLATPSNTRAGIKDLINQVTTIHKGFERLKAEHCRHILTSMTEAILTKELRTLWNQRTDSIREVPPIEDLLLFLKQQADQAEEELPTPKYSTEKNREKQHPAKSKGSANVSSIQPAEQQQVAAPAKASFPREKSNDYKTRSQFQIRYSCPLCPQQQHYAFFCSLFNDFSLLQKKEHVRIYKLCNNCLKPGHDAANCRSDRKCKTCNQRHNTFLHEGGNQPAAQHQASTNVLSPKETPKMKSALVSTTQLIVKGPTGLVSKARTLLDGGSSISIISHRLLKTLQLKKTKDSIFITGVGQSSPQTAYPLASVHLSSLYRPDWTLDLVVAVLPKVTSDLLLKAASSVRALSHIKDLKLADEQFDIPGRVHLLLGEDAMRDVFLPGENKGPPGTPIATHTVFGWVLRGCYTPDESTISKQLPVNAASTQDENPTTDNLLAKFWELEEPPAACSALTPEEEQVESHYNETHSYDSAAKRYTVSLPRKVAGLTLGESRSQALNRARANERSLLRKGTWEKFQAVVQEYIDLDHAQKVTQQDMALPSSDCYYMPMHGVYKESSSTPS